PLPRSLACVRLRPPPPSPPFPYTTLFRSTTATTGLRVQIRPPPAYRRAISCTPHSVLGSTPSAHVPTWTTTTLTRSATSTKPKNWLPVLKVRTPPTTISYTTCRYWLTTSTSTCPLKPP